MVIQLLIYIYLHLRVKYTVIHSGTQNSLPPFSVSLGGGRLFRVPSCTVRYHRDEVVATLNCHDRDQGSNPTGGAPFTPAVEMGIGLLLEMIKEGSQAWRWPHHSLVWQVKETVDSSSLSPACLLGTEDLSLPFCFLYTTIVYSWWSCRCHKSNKLIGLLPAVLYP